MFIHDHRNAWPVRIMCAALGMSASGYYAWRSRPESGRVTASRDLLTDIRRIHHESSGCYGSPRVHAVLRGYGRRIGRARIDPGGPAGKGGKRGIMCPIIAFCAARLMVGLLAGQTG